MPRSDSRYLDVPFLGNLRPMAHKDAEDLTLACRDAETLRWTTVPPAYTVDMAHSFIDNPACKWTMADAQDRFCGVIELRPKDDHTADVGYHTAPWARGQGMTTTALVKITDWAFTQGFHRVELRADVDNIASIRVAEKAGFIREGTERGAQYLHGRYNDMAVFARLATDPAPSEAVD